MRPVPMLCLAACSAALLLGSSGCAGNEPTSSIGPGGTDPAASISASPSQPATVHVGDTVLVRTTISGQVTWTVRDTAVLRQLSGGTVVAKAVGTSYVVASGAKRRNAGQRDSSLITVDAIAAPADTTKPDTTSSTTTPTVHAGYYVAPTGSSGGDGSVDRPWDMLTALAGASGRIKPGDTVWVRGGTYRGGEFRSTLVGTASAPIIMRRYPGERATIDGNMVINGSNTAFWGLEVMNSNPVSTGKQGIDVRAPGTKLIDLVVHDAGKSGIGFWMEAPDAEITGCIVYNNGTHENLDHGIYVMNSTGTKLITNNVLFNNLAYGLHGYGQNPQQLRNIVADGNTIFNSASISSNYISKPNLLVGGAGVVASGIKVTNNTLYYSGATGESNLRLGYDTTVSLDLTASGNYVVGGTPALEMRQWSTVTMAKDTFYTDGRMLSLTVKPGWSGSSNNWTANVFDRDPTSTSWALNGTKYNFSGWKSATGLGATDQALAQVPTGVRVVVRPDKYEPGRAFVTVNNWAQQAAVAVDLSNVLRVGDRYEARSVQNVFGTPVASGTYGGGTISLPMGTIQPPAPIGRTTRVPPVTGPKFDVFVITRVAN